ncbi:MAG: DNA-binding response regulator [Anaerolineae bacterium]|nr:MAG: DNA-binding response regulator [Anaerolineae bacterium]
MNKATFTPPQRILIASGHALFGEGLRNLLEQRWERNVRVVGVVQSTAEAIAAFHQQSPDVVIVDHDYATIDLAELLKTFFSAPQDVRVVVLSLGEGVAGKVATVYARQTVPVSRIEEWLHIELPGTAEEDVTAEH